MAQKKRTTKPRAGNGKSWGGKREGSGKPTRFPNKMKDPRVILMTKRGYDVMERARNRLNLSRSDFVEALTRLHGSALTLNDVASVMD